MTRPSHGEPAEPRHTKYDYGEKTGRFGGISPNQYVVVGSRGTDFGFPEEILEVGRGYLFVGLQGRFCGVRVKEDVVLLGACCGPEWVLPAASE